MQLIREVFRGHPRCGVIAANIASPGAPGGEVPVAEPPFATGEFIGCGQVPRAEAVRRAGGYPQFLDGYGAEETLLALGILGAGYEIIFVPALRVFHARGGCWCRAWARRC